MNINFVNLSALVTSWLNKYVPQINQIGRKSLKDTK